MTERAVRGSLLLITVVLQMFAHDASPSTGRQPSQNRIAGHRVLKILDRKDTSISFFPPDCIFQDREGRFWIGSFFGLCSYDEAKDQWTTFSKKTGQLSGYEVNEISQSGDEALWFASYKTLGRHLTRFAGGRWSSIDSESDGRNLDRFSTMFSGLHGKVWFALGDQLIAYDGGTWTAPLRIADEERKTQIPSEFHIVAGRQAIDGYVWLGTYRGIVRIDEKKREWKWYGYGVTRGTVYLIYEDRRRRLWFANDYGDVYLLDQANDSWTSFSLLPHLPTGVQRSSAAGPGRALFSPEGIYQDATGLVMFPTRDGLITFNERANKWETLTSRNSALPSDSLSAVFEDRNGRVWLGTGSGIVVLEP